MGLVHITFSMDAILACHPTLSTECLGWVAMLCDLWRICKGPEIAWQRNHSNYYPGQKNWDNHVHVAQASDLSSMHTPMIGLRACLNFFGQGSSTSPSSDKISAFSYVITAKQDLPVWYHGNFLRSTWTSRSLLGFPLSLTMLSSLLIRFRLLWTDQLIIGRAVFGVVFGLFVFLLLLFVLLLCAGCVSSHGDSKWIMYWSLFSSTFDAHCQYEDVAIALIRWICQSATSFPACLTTWREP